MNLNLKTEFKGCLGRDTAQARIPGPTLCTVDSLLPVTCANVRGELQVLLFRTRPWWDRRVVVVLVEP